MNVLGSNFEAKRPLPVPMVRLRNEDEQRSAERGNEQQQKKRRRRSRWAGLSLPEQARPRKTID
jgi:hypothetical protein